MKIAFTTATINYLPRAITLAHSFLHYNNHYQFWIFLIDPLSKKVDPFLREDIRFISIEELQLKEMPSLLNHLSISEISFSLKPILAEYILNQNPDVEHLLYFDGDIYFYNPITEIDKLFEKYDLILTPHFTKPINDDKIPTELDILRTGLYNMGFAGIKNTLVAKKILEWWKNRVLEFGVENHDLGLSADQMWMSLAPLFFENVGLLKHPGYNFAYWNVHERQLSLNENKYKINEKFPLIFVHFADFDPGNPKQFTNPKHFNRIEFGQNKALDTLCKEYADALKKNHFYAYHLIRSKYALSFRVQALRKIKKPAKRNDSLKYTIIYVLSFFPSGLRKLMRKFSLFILRNIK